MLEATGKNRTPIIAGAGVRVLVTALFVWTSAIYPVLAETAKTPETGQGSRDKPDGTPPRLFDERS